MGWGGRFPKVLSKQKITPMPKDWRRRLLGEKFVITVNFRLFALKDGKIDKPPVMTLECRSDLKFQPQKYPAMATFSHFNYFVLHNYSTF